MGNPKYHVLIANSDTIKSLYYNKVLTSGEVSSYTGKSIPHVIKVLTELKNKGYIEERGLATSTGGRKPITYSLVAKSHYIVSVAIDRHSASLVMVDMNNNFIGEVEQHEFDLHHLSADNLVDIISAFIGNSSVAKSKIIGLGLTMPGFVDTVKGINYTYMNLRDDSLVDFIQRHLHLPVFIDNDSTAIALAEQKFGVAANSKNAMVLNLGWGIGLGMILNDQIFRGDNGLAGEFSHIPLFKNGKLCDCGKHGCLETEASFVAIVANAKEAIGNGETTSLANYPELNADRIIEEAIKGDRFAVKLISEAAYHVGEGLAILIHLMNPRIILLSGKGSVVGKIWLAPIQQALNEHCIPMLTSFTEIAISDLNNRAQLIGGAALVIESLGKTFQDKLDTLKAEPVNQIH
ncbi:ROK family protein [Mucilaginibacter sp. RS28]|uniref:ROK family protein n=1 Tax=Mucilaginibacter straminoryzae TaxID=2932774 RepID=A0A9X1X2J1_9SPHI|nr:ROK family protein [Mucilaginibacter straminoryzae]MCJ8209828.1 ROK family protein [Mucilaginibacter straminoryzae]